ncbi:MAG TPA: alpha/beta fold hydrolase [Sphingomicrobium sp.]|nr:alpha/beta fold hydrolase [Sphingomicrobium sp.]
MIGLMMLAATSAMTVPGPNGPLQGTFVDAGKGSPVAVIVPGSGPTDRDGNNPMGVTAASYRLLAEALATEGISSVRIDKRGMFGSKAAIADPNKVTIADYAADTRAWAKAAADKAGTKCAWLIGHSEGGLIALTAGQQRDGICGVVALAAPGRKLGTVIREQLKANPANAPLLEPAEKALVALEAGRTVDASTLPAPLTPLFNASVQPFVIDLLAKDPAALAGSLAVPLLVVQPEADLQVSVTDAKALAAGQPKAKLVIVPGVNHVLKAASATDRGANMATYADPSLPVAAAVVDAIADFVKR